MTLWTFESLVDLLVMFFAISAITDIYIKRAKRLVSRNMRVQWIKDHDVDSLEGKGNWASIEELHTVIPFHREHF